VNRGCRGRGGRRRISIRSPTVLLRLATVRMTTAFEMPMLMRLEDRRFGVINVRVLHALLDTFPEPVPMDYESESTAERHERRQPRWTPVTAGRRSAS